MLALREWYSNSSLRSTAGCPFVPMCLVEFADFRLGEIGQELRQVALRVDDMPPAGAGETGEDRGGLAAAWPPTKRPAPPLTPAWSAASSESPAGGTEIVASRLALRS
jgi:hypothetical protein